jgi:starch phosphorylase
MEESTWYSRKFKDEDANHIAYFSAEFGLTESLQIYSGGLGVLSGDHLKSASDLGIAVSCDWFMLQGRIFSAIFK